MVQNNTYTVYMHVNKINGKKYIGITSRTPEKRWQNGRGYNKNPYFSNAINKYGWENFDHLILYKNITKKEAEQYEIDLIRQYNSVDRRYGYNIQNGGNTIGTMSEEIKQKISLANKGKPSWIKGKHISASTKHKIHMANMGKEPIYAYDRFSGKFIAKYNNLQTASTSTGLSTSEICAVYNYRAKSIGGYIFRYATDDLNIGEDLPEKEYDISKNMHLRPIKQYDKNGGFIKEYSSIKEAEMAFGKKQGSTLIWHCVNHKKPSALGYLWSYADEEVIIPISNREKRIEQYDLDHKYITTFNSVKSAAAFLGVSDSTLIIHLKSSDIPYKNYFWKYA